MAVIMVIGWALPHALIKAIVIADRENLENFGMLLTTFEMGLLPRENHPRLLFVPFAGSYPYKWQVDLEVQLYGIWVGGSCLTTC